MSHVLLKTELIRKKKKLKENLLMEILNYGNLHELQENRITFDRCCIKKKVQSFIKRSMPSIGPLSWLRILAKMGVCSTNDLWLCMMELNVKIDLNLKFQNPIELEQICYYKQSTVLWLYLRYELYNKISIDK